MELQPASRSRRVHLGFNFMFTILKTLGIRHARAFVRQDLTEESIPNNSVTPPSEPSHQNTTRILRLGLVE